jgi:hypothetical protein
MLGKDLIGLSSFYVGFMSFVLYLFDTVLRCLCAGRCVPGNKTRTYYFLLLDCEHN